MSTVPARPTSLAPAEAMLPVPFTVRKVRQEIEGIFTFWLEPPEGGFDFLPGQFNMLYAFGAGEVPISISGDPDDPSVLVHTIRVVGKATERLCSLKKGQTMGVRGPFGTPWPVEELKGRDILFATSGLGLAPLRPALYHVLNHRDDYGKAILIYGARTPDRLLYTDELHQWGGRFDFDLELSVGSAPPQWTGHIGTATSLIGQVPLDPANSTALVCSSERMMRAMADQLGQGGLADHDIILSLERSMKCGLGLCGHCQLGPTFICKDGPVYRYDRVRDLIARREL